MMETQPMFNKPKSNHWKDSKKPHIQEDVNELTKGIKLK